MASSAPEDDALKGEKLMSTLLELPYDFVLRIGTLLPRTGSFS